MKESNWNDCLFLGSAKKVSPNINRVKSLIETAEERISLISEVNERNCNFVFEDYYTSLIELLQAVAFSSGYNILNHICLGFYLKEVLKRADLFRMFDDVRFKRNSLTYYGKKMDFEIAKDAILKCKILLKSMREVLKWRWKRLSSKEIYRCTKGLKLSFS